MTLDSPPPNDAMAVVHRDPRLAIKLAERELSSATTLARDRALAYWARGMARRESDDLDGAATDLEEAMRIAADVRDPVLAANVAVTMALVVVYRGDPVESRRLLDEAEPWLGGGDLGRLEMQRALIDHRSGDLGAALERYQKARRLLEGADDDVVLARLHGNLGILHVYLHDLRAAVHHCDLSSFFAQRSGQNMLQGSALHNLGFALGRLGKVVEALEAFDEAERIYQTLPPSPMYLALELDRSAVLREANLVSEARRSADRALEATRRSGNQIDLADAALLAGRCRSAAGDVAAAQAAIDESIQLFERNGRDAWVPLAQLEGLRSDSARDGQDLSPEQLSLPKRLADLGWMGESIEASVILAKRMLASSDFEAADRLLAGVHSSAHLVSPTHRAAAHLARALLARGRGERGRARRSITEGLRVLSTNQAALGATELRAHAVGHATELARVGLEMAIADGRPREFLERMEQSLSGVDTVQGVRAPDDPQLSAALSELRGVVSALDEKARAGADTWTEQNRRRELQSTVQSLDRRQRSNGAARHPPVSEGLGVLGAASLIEYATVGEQAWAVSVVRGRCRLHDLGDVVVLREEIESLTHSLNRLSRQGSSPASVAAAAAVVDAVGVSLSERLIPPIVARSSAPLVVVPTGVLSAIPWSVLPPLARRPVSIAASLAAWSQPHTRSTQQGRALVVSGPGLPFGPSEVAQVAATHKTARVLSGSEATVDEFLECLPGADIGHFACHGTFRSDNPLFSSLRLADGDLTFYDLGGRKRLPRTIVMSACNAGRNAALEGGALLGMASALVQLGVSSVIAPLTPVNDERSVDLMVRLHTHLADGVEPAEALALASTGPDGELDPTAAPFICFGS